MKPTGPGDNYLQKRKKLVMGENHGNRLRPRYEAYQVKKERSRRVYAETQMKLDSCWLNEKLLREQYNRYGTEYEEDPRILKEKGFEFRSYNDEIDIDGIKAYIMKKHGWFFTEEKKIKVCKI
jgi:hypothetical protein